jgi:hypothetical protein
MGMGLAFEGRKGKVLCVDTRTVEHRWDERDFDD